MVPDDEDDDDMPIGTSMRRSFSDSHLETLKEVPVGADEESGSRTEGTNITYPFQQVCVYMTYHMTISIKESFMRGHSIQATGATGLVHCTGHAGRLRAIGSPR